MAGSILRKEPCTRQDKAAKTLRQCKFLIRLPELQFPELSDRACHRAMVQTLVQGSGRLVRSMRQRFLGGGWQA